MLKSIEGKTFTGVSDYHQDPSCFLRMGYTPGKLVVDNKGPMAHVVAELAFDGDYNVIAMTETTNGNTRSYSPAEIDGFLKYGMLESRFLFNDPRYALHVAQDVRKISDDVYDISIWEVDFPVRSECRAEFHLDAGTHIRRMKPVTSYFTSQAMMMEMMMMHSVRGQVMS